MPRRILGQTNFSASTIGLGTWVMGGSFWGGAEDGESKKAIEAAIASGINLIDTAPVYGFGRSETLLGEVLTKKKLHDSVIIATKCGLEWNEDEKIRRNCSKNRILQEIEDTRKRLNRDVIDLYQLHWPDEKVEFGKSMEAMMSLYEKGTIKAIGVSNFNVEQIKACMRYGHVHTLQPPYSMFEREIEKEILPFCIENNIAVLSYGSICKGLLSGKFNEDSTFKQDDIRSRDKEFQGDKYKENLAKVEKLRSIAKRKDVSLTQLAISWAIHQKGINCALVGTRTNKQIEESAKAMEVNLSEDELREIKEIIS